MDPVTLRRRLQEAQEHVARGEWHVARQRAILRHLQESGLDATMAKALLRTLEQLQAVQLAGRNQLVQALAVAEARIAAAATPAKASDLTQ